MGCDIHMYAEVRKDGKWEKAGEVFDNPWYKPDLEIEWNTPKTDEPYCGRNYDLFAILANVRNGYGFAGVPTGTGFNPIDKPRGLPEDVSKEVKGLSGEWGLDGHNHSYLLLSELLGYDWEGQATTHYGVFSEEEYVQFKKTGVPGSHAGDVFGSNVVVVNGDEIFDVPNDGKSYHTRASWEETYAQSVGPAFLERTLPALKELGHPDDVRIVFWFDN